MPNLQTLANPFAMMIDPQAVLARVERSERLGLLERRVCRPLDRPLIGRVNGDAAASFDQALDLEGDNETEHEPSAVAEGAAEGQGRGEPN